MNYTVTELKGNENESVRKRYARSPTTHPDVLETIAKYDINYHVCRSLLENPAADDSLKDIVKERFKHVGDIWESVCPLLWNHISTFSNGDVRSCCEMILPETGHVKIYTEDGETINVHKHNLEQVRNSPTAKQRRTLMMKNIKPKECHQCFHREELGMDSKRIGALNLYGYGFTDYLEHTQEDGTIDTSKIPLKNLDLRFGNTCNLKCRSCGPADSNLWYEDTYKLYAGNSKEYDLNFYGETKYKLIEEKGSVTINTKDFDWEDENEFYQNLLDNMNTVDTIYFTGGEPTVIKKHKQLLEYCIKNGFAKNIQLDYNSNLHATPTYLSEYWREFKFVYIGASIDGFGPVQGYMRPPSTWEGVKNNMLKLEDLKLDNMRISISPTISIMNILNMPKLVDWVLSLDNPKVIQRRINNHTLYYPEYYNVQVLPLKVKEYILQEYEKWFDSLSYDPEMQITYKEQFTPVLDFMMQEDRSDELHRFFTFQNKLDAIRNETWETGLPEIYGVLKDYDV